MNGSAGWTMRELRYSRSDPPRNASQNPHRQSIYRAALQQFEELLHAASVVGASSKPLPLFYALSQGGRAIVAARGDSDVYEIRGHGLCEDRTGSADREILDRRIERVPSRNGSDAFGAVAAATGSGDIQGSVPLGAAWVATPDL